MSKSINTIAAHRNAAAAADLKNLFEHYPNASIRKLAAATNINYGILLKKSKEPIPGEAYDPEAINWEAIANKLRDKGIDFASLNWEAMNAGPNRQGASLQKDISAYNVGDKVYLRKNNTTPYTIVYKTATHIVIMLDGTTEPQALAHNTFILYGPASEPRATKSEKIEIEEA